MYPFGERIKRLREQCGYTQEQLAVLLGTTKASISAYELGVNTPPTQKLHQLAAILHTSPSYLIDRDAPRTIDISHLTEEQEAAVRHIISEFDKANTNV